MPKIKPLKTIRKAVRMSARDNYEAQRHRHKIEAQKLMKKTQRKMFVDLRATILSVGGPGKTTRRRK